MRFRFLLIFCLLSAVLVAQKRPDQQPTKVPEATDAIYTQENPAGVIRKIKFDKAREFFLAQVEPTCVSSAPPALNANSTYKGKFVTVCSDSRLYYVDGNGRSQLVYEPNGGATYSAGSGINISPTGVISNLGDTNQSDDITTSTTIGGDLNGTLPNPTVDGLQGRPVSSAVPSLGQVLKWSGSAWVPSADAGGISTVTDGTTIDFTQAGSNVTGEVKDNSIGNAKLINSSITAAKLAQSGATTNQVLKWNGSAWVPDSVFVFTDTTMQGAGTVASPLSVAPPTAGKSIGFFGDSFSATLTSDIRHPKAVLAFTKCFGVTYAVAGHTAAQQATVLANLLTADPNALDTLDFVLVHLGANDYAQNVTIGDINSAVNSATFSGKLKYIITTIAAASPGTKIYVVAPPEGFGNGVNYKVQNSAGWTMKDLASLISEVADYYSVPVINLWAMSQWNQATSAYYTSDLLHPSVEGATAIGRIIADALINNTTTSKVLTSGGVTTSHPITGTGLPGSAITLDASVAVGKSFIKQSGGWVATSQHHSKFDFATSDSASTAPITRNSRVRLGNTDQSDSRFVSDVAAGGTYAAGFVGPIKVTSGTTVLGLSSGDLVSTFGRFVGGFGALSTSADPNGGALDFRNVTNRVPGSGYTLLRGNSAANAPNTSYAFWHTFNFKYIDTTNYTQIAVPLGDATSLKQGLHITGKHGGVFSSFYTLPAFLSSGIANGDVLTASVSGGEFTFNSDAIGGDLSGTISNLQIGAGTVGTTEIAADAVTSAKIPTDAIGSSEIAANAVTTSEIADVSVTMAKLNQSSATHDQVIAWNSFSTTWAPKGVGAILAGTGTWSALSANYTLDDTNVNSFADANTGNITITCGTDTKEGMPYRIKCRRNTSNTITISTSGLASQIEYAGGSVIPGPATYILPSYAVVTVTRIGAVCLVQ